MRAAILLFLSFLIGFNSSQAQELLSENEKLAATAKVWGFLKYYHPHVAKGKFDWDQQLLKILPPVAKADTKEALSEIYLAWIDFLGNIDICKKCQVSPDTAHFNKNFDLSWFDNKRVFTQALSEKLRFIEQNRFQGKHHYVTSGRRGASLRLTNEKSYEDFDWTNRALRLLSLFRYWNVMEYFYPHKYQIDMQWDEVLWEMLPKFSSPDSELAFHLAMLELVVKIDDSHGYFSTPLLHDHFGMKQIPADFRIMEDQLVITTIYEPVSGAINDLKAGEVISKVEGVAVAEILKEKLKYINGANGNAKLKHAFGKILHGATDSVTVEISSGEETEVRKLARYPFEQLRYNAHPKPWELLQNNMGYIHLGLIEEKELPKALTSMGNANALILDLRNYPKEYYGGIFSNFLGARNTVVTKQVKPDLKYPGKYTLSDQQKIPKKTTKFKGEVVLLVNEYTQSRAEYTAMWIQNGYQVTTIGSQTAGAAGLMIHQEFVGGYRAYFTSGGIFYPDMTPLQRQGVKIDIEIKPTIQGIRDGKDEVFEKAIEFLNRNM
jgi:carboxyl-terminal processing protease